MQHRNIYIRSLEIGFERENKGISLNQLKRKLIDEGYEVDDRTFRIWYFSNFEHMNRKLFLADPMTNYIQEESNDKINPLSSDSFMQYVEYLELKESRESTRKALRQAKYATIIAIISILLNVIFSSPISGIFYNYLGKTKIDQKVELPTSKNTKGQETTIGVGSEIDELSLLSDSISSNDTLNTELKK